VTSSELAERLDCEPTTLTVVGVEREYRVLDTRGQPLDFRPLIGTLSLPGAGLDPGDPNAHHLPSGVMLTADGPEAEAAIPPMALEENFTWHVTAWAEHAEDVLVDALPAGTAIEGYSTHLNVSVGADVIPVADLFARHFALGMMLLLDQADSPGLLVRPRAGRLELGGDYIEGEQLRAALTYAAAAARCCVTALLTKSEHALPAPITGPLERAKDRPGWFVPSRTVGRDALARAWYSARDHLLNVAHRDELDAVDEMVRGNRPLPREHLSGPDQTDTPRRSPFANLAPRDRGRLQVRVRAMSWAAVAFEVRSTQRQLHVVVPRRWLGSFLERLDAGALDEILATAAPTRRNGSGPRVVLGEFDARSLVPPEPHLRRSWLHERRPEVVGAIAGTAAVAAAFRFWPW
jgi:hypothetical protein